MESDIATRIRTARRIAGITQAELASRLRVTRSAVANWERVSGVWPASSRMLSIAVITGVSYEWLATGRGVPIDHTLPAAVAGELVDDPKELRMLRAFRGCHSAMRRALLEMAESQRHRRA
ncbi:MAG TPA: helix-turn-helix transcriptional regulator [Stenotrophomonas sp.]|jgi:transcriptional regulator with XRE-family HTH domain